MERVDGKPHIAIIYTFNDIPEFPGGQRGGVKSFIDYFEQFLISYESINDNWKGDTFTYEFHIIHTKPFSEKKYKLLDELGVNVHFIKNAFGNTMMRGNAFMIDIDCDFRLALDNDLIGVSEPDFDFDMDIQGGFGGSKWTRKEWENICEWLNIPCPPGTPITKGPGAFNNWSSNEYVRYITTGSDEGLFPYWNAGCLFIRNSISKYYGALLTASCFKYFKNPQYEVPYFFIQDCMGPVANAVTDKWSTLPIGTNMLCLYNQPKVVEFNQNYKGKVSLVHYIMLYKNQRFGKMVVDYHNKIKEKYLKW